MNSSQLDQFNEQVAQILSANGAHDVAQEDALMDSFRHLCEEFLSVNDLAALATLLNQTENLCFQVPVHRYEHMYYQVCHAYESSDYARVIMLCDQALAAKDDLPDILLMKFWRELGYGFEGEGRYDDSRQAHTRCLQLCEELGNIVEQSKTWVSLGLLFYHLIDYQQAQQYFETALDLVQQTTDRELLGMVLNELGTAQKAQGEWQSALDYYSQSLKIWQELDLPINQAMVTNNLGEVYHLINKVTQAKDCYETALQLALAHNVLDEAADMCHNLGFLWFTQGDLETALQYYEEGLKLAQQTNQYFVEIQIHYRCGQCRQQQGQLDEAFEAYAVAVDLIEPIRSLTRQHDTRMSLFAAWQHIYQTMILLCLQRNDTRTAFDYVERARSRVFLDLLGTLTLSEEAEAKIKPLSTDQIQARLPIETTLLEYFSTGSVGPHAQLLSKLPPQSQYLREALAPPEHLFAFVVTRTSLDVKLIKLSVKLLELQHFERGTGRLIGVTPPLRPLSRWHDLAVQLIHPLRDYCAGQRHLFFAPHGVLHYLPLHALDQVEPMAGNPNLTISYTPSASILLRTDLTIARSHQVTNGLVVGVNGEGLQHAEREALQIAAYLRNQQVTVKELIGSIANPADVQASLSNAEVIHISSHGYFRPEDPMQSALVLSKGELTAADILTRPLQKAQLVTLSACQTGLNHLAPGDELIGLTRAWLSAGARSLLVTLWMVPDLPTRLLMQHFYVRWLAGASLAVALAEAQQYLRSFDEKSLRAALVAEGVPPAQANANVDEYRETALSNRLFDHPYYWAAFVLIGDPR